MVRTYRPKPKTQVACKWCGKSFTRSANNQVYCSADCRPQYEGETPKYRREYQAKYREKNVEKIRAYQREYQRQYRASKRDLEK